MKKHPNEPFAVNISITIFKIVIKNYVMPTEMEIYFLESNISE